MTEQIAEQIELEVDAPQIEAPVEQPSLRDSLLKARDTVQEKQEEPVAKPAVDKARAEDGKFVKAPKEAKVKKVASAAEAPVEAASVIEAIKPHQFIKPALRANWDKLSPDVQKVLNEREEEAHKEFTKQDEERNFGKQLKEVIMPYMPQMRAENANPIQAVSALLDTAYKLRTMNPQQKGQLLWETARQFGADMSQGNTQGAQVPFNPQLHQIQQELQNVKAEREREQAQKKQQEEERVLQVVNSFSSDSVNYPYFDQVQQEMMALLGGGMFKEEANPSERLKKVYDYAVHANPLTRSTLLEAQKAESEEKQVADKKAKAEAARKAGSSVKGAPGMSALKNGHIPQPDLRSELRAAMAAHREG